MNADERLRDALARVEGDLHALSELATVTLAAGGGDPRAGVLLCEVMSGGEAIAWIPVPAGVSVDEMSHQVANELQDVLVGRHVFAAWPKCPDHEHQLLANLRRARATWKCPTTKRHVCTIGRYADVTAEGRRGEES